MSDFAIDNMNDYDDDGGFFGDGKTEFRNATFDIYVTPDDPIVTIRANGYDQDCLDTKFGGSHKFRSLALLDCYAVSVPEYGDNEAFNKFQGILTFRAPLQKDRIYPIDTADYSLILFVHPDIPPGTDPEPHRPPCPRGRRCQPY